MEVLTLLNRAKAAGLRVQIEGDEVVVRGPRSAANVVDEIKQHRSAIHRYLTDDDRHPDQGPPDSAKAHWDVTLRDVSQHWNRARATRSEIPQLPDDIEAPLEHEVAAALRAGDIELTRAAAARWHAAPLEHLGVPPNPLDAADPFDSETLGERIVVAFREDAVEAARLAHPDRVVYNPDEVEHLHSETATDELLRAGHLAKKELGGTVIDPDLLDLEPRTSRSVHTMLTAASTRFESRTQNIVT